ncbi:MAG: hypothetical protein F6J97_13305 [Leptolyngbya sp. SIO4C1]|nr:hypothetical protein [Leptolyngbya sp. SIO4C1]
MTYSADFWIWAAAMLLVLGLGGGAIALAALRPLGRQVPFPQPVSTLSLVISDAAQQQLQTGLRAYQTGRYGVAIDAFNRLIEREPSCAEAFHNRGLTHANLGKTNLAVGDLVKAGELYDQQRAKAGVDTVKAQLQQLAQRV